MFICFPSSHHGDTERLFKCCCSTIGREQHYDLTLENQHGDAIVLDKGDQESLVMGMSLYDKGKLFMKQVQPRPYTQLGLLDHVIVNESRCYCRAGREGEVSMSHFSPIEYLCIQGDFQAALDVLLLSEEAFSCCKSAIKDSADNEGLLMLDIVW